MRFLIPILVCVAGSVGAATAWAGATPEQEEVDAFFHAVDTGDKETIANRADLSAYALKKEAAYTWQMVSRRLHSAFDPSKTNCLNGLSRYLPEPVLSDAQRSLFLKDAVRLECHELLGAAIKSATDAELSEALLAFSPQETLRGIPADDFAALTRVSALGNLVAKVLKERAVTKESPLVAAGQAFQDKFNAFIDRMIEPEASFAPCAAWLQGAWFNGTTHFTFNFAEHTLLLEGRPKATYKLPILLLGCIDETARLEVPPYVLTIRRHGNEINVRKDDMDRWDTFKRTKAGKR